MLTILDMSSSFYYSLVFCLDVSLDVLYRVLSFYLIDLYDVLLSNIHLSMLDLHNLHQYTS